MKRQHIGAARSREARVRGPTGWLGVSRVCLVAMATLVSGCLFDRSGLGSPGSPDSGPGVDAAPPRTDGHVAPDASLPDAALPDASPPDASPPDTGPPPCVDDTFECLSTGGAQLCQGGVWTPLGPCPLGCDQASRFCYLPSNVDVGLTGGGAGDVDLGAAGTPVHVNTDTGRIWVDGGPDLRPAGPGLDPGSGIEYEQQNQPSFPGIGVFALHDLDIPDSVDVIAEGSRSLAILASGDVTISGVIYVNSEDDHPGPGGFSGGGATHPGFGPCGGQVGTGREASHGCASGGGGGGYGGAGGDGGDTSCSGGLSGGTGGADTCGTDALIPLIGGSGGAGGANYADDGDNSSNSSPGSGGGGGGAIQISAAGSITIASGGGIHAGGGPGADCTSAGGAGGGAGGGVLLESILVRLEAGSIVAANGGGGGAGDCT